MRVSRFVVAIGPLLATLAHPAWGQNSPPVVSNVVAAQTEGTGLVEVTYDVADADGDQVVATLICSSDNGVTFDLLAATVSGDVHVPMDPGPGKSITWNAGADYPGQYWPEVVAKVIVSDSPDLSGAMVFVPAGQFTMGWGTGAYGPVHTVYLDAFYIDITEVTNAQFEVFIDAAGYSTEAFWSADGWAWRTANGITEPLNWTTGEHSGTAWPGFPVVGVSWYEAEAYAAFVGKRLPTEAEWEKAARSVDERTYPWGEDTDSHRWNHLTSNDPYDNGSTPVGFYDGRLHPSPPYQTIDSPGPYGTYDQSGNAWEWVADWYSATYYGESPPGNPPGPETGSGRVRRGGSWSFQQGSSRTFARDAEFPENRGIAMGFRCARTP